MKIVNSMFTHHSTKKMPMASEGNRKICPVVCWGWLRRGVGSCSSCPFAQISMYHLLSTLPFFGFAYMHLSSVDRHAHTHWRTGPDLVSQMYIFGEFREGRAGPAGARTERAVRRAASDVRRDSLGDGRGEQQGFHAPVRRVAAGGEASSGAVFGHAELQLRGVQCTGRCAVEFLFTFAG